MKRFFLLCLLAVAQATAAQDVKKGEDLQEVKKAGSLQEVTVQGVRTVRHADGQWIYPTRRQLTGSANGYVLLAGLALPQIRVDETARAITALSNRGAVQVRVNGLVASADDLLALDVKAVERIEYTDSPGVRYGEGVAYVLNIIVRRSTSGYTVGSDLTGALMAADGNGMFYGKVNAGKSELGVSYSLGYEDLKGRTYSEQAAYELESGEVRTVDRQLLSGREQELSHRLQLTYNLSDSDYVFQARISGLRSIRPSRSHEVMLVDGATVTDDDRTHMASPVVDLYYHRSFARHQSLTANAVGTFIRTDAEEERNEGGAYRYTAAGRTGSLWGEAVYENRLRPFTLSTGLQYSQKYTHNVYGGAAQAVNDMRSSGLYAFAQLQGRLARLGYNAGMGLSRQYQHQAAERHSFWLFRPKLSVTYPLTRRLKASYDFEVSQHISQIALVSDVSIKQNAYETLVGNPAIVPNSVRTHDLRLTYATSRLTAELQGYYRQNEHCNLEKYIRRGGHFYQTQTNAGSECSFFFIQGSGRWEMLEGRLSASLYGGVYRFFNRGEDYMHTYTAFNGGASLAAYLGAWTLTARADNGWNFMEGEHQGHQAPAWNAGVAYRLHRLTMALRVEQPFSSRPLVHRARVVNRYVRKDMEMRSRDMGNRLIFQLTWELSSGRKYHDIRRTMNHQDRETGILK